MCSSTCSQPPNFASALRSRQLRPFLDCSKISGTATQIADTNARCASVNWFHWARSSFHSGPDSTKLIWREPESSLVYAARGSGPPRQVG